MDMDALNATVLRQYIKAGVPVLLPVGSMEVHGPHLPLGTDVYIVQALCRLIARRTPVIEMPPVWYALTDTTNELQGTLNVPLEVAAAYVKSICLSLIENNFTRIVVLNIHGRNNLYLPAVASEVFLESDVPVLYIDPYTAFMKELDEAVLGKIHNHKKETTLLLAALDILGKKDLLDLSGITTVEVEKPESLKRLLSAGQVGYYYNRDEQHISPRAGVSLEDGISYLNQVADRLVPLFEDLEAYSRYVCDNPRKRKRDL